MVVALGNLSEESKGMLFHEYKNELKCDKKRGTGYVLKNGADLESIQVPPISDFEKLNHYIKKSVTR